MIVDSLFLVFMGSTLTLLALVSGFFIVVEIVYISPDESATLSGVTITDVYFM